MESHGMPEFFNCETLRTEISNAVPISAKVGGLAGACFFGGFGLVLIMVWV
jgi:hypothetical protein